ncbi:MAG: hypothetical protein K8R36_22895 [Planctomycetales bacterium]|nr:hypothetical protein [Planctomycetales bacterium]
MLSLKTTSSQRWLDQAAANLPELLIDHAHCEKKAAGTAMNLLFAYVENVDLCRAMTEIVQEELSHFHMVLDILAARGIPFRKLSPSSYGRTLNDLVSKQEPRRAVDRLLRHHSTYVRLAKSFASEDEVRVRLEELADAEAAIIAEGDAVPRMHS